LPSFLTTVLAVAASRSLSVPGFLTTSVSSICTASDCSDVGNRRPILADLKKIELATLKKKFNPEHMILIKTDRACRGNSDHKGPGGWGAVISHCREYAEMFGPHADTSNNEMELKAMLMAIMETPLYSYVIIESDSQLCIDTLATYAKR
jgi:hypothetical protein